MNSVLGFAPFVSSSPFAYIVFILDAVLHVTWKSSIIGNICKIRRV